MLVLKPSNHQKPQEQLSFHFIALLIFKVRVLEQEINEQNRLRE